MAALTGIGKEVRQFAKKKKGRRGRAAALGAAATMMMGGDRGGAGIAEGLPPDGSRPAEPLPLQAGVAVPAAGRQASRTLQHAVQCQLQPSMPQFLEHAPTALS
eukprot:gene14806-20652_t